MADVQTANSNPATQATALLDGGANLLLTEREIVRQVREYATKNGISAQDAQAYISYLNGSGSYPAWLGQAGTDGGLHVNSRELHAINLLKTDRDEALTAFRSAAVANGVNADTGIAEMRRALNAGSLNADEIAIAMFNTMGQKDGKPFSNYLTDLAYPQHGSAYFNGIDKLEFAQRKWNEAWTKAGELFTTAKDKAAEVAAPVIGGAQAAGEQGGSVLGNFWDSAKEKFSGLTFGGVAGTVGVGGLFYMIGNALSASVLGHGWLSRILGLAIGAFGAMLGYRTFGGGNDDEQNPNTPRSRVEAGRGLRHDGQATAPDLSHLRGEGRSGSKTNGEAYCAPDDRNCDGERTVAEIHAYARRMERSIAQLNKAHPGAFVPPEPTSPVVPNANPQNTRGTVGRGQ